jgi:glycerate-2-kinase
VRSLGSANRGEARSEGAALAELCVGLLQEQPYPRRRFCVLSGGEPTVRLAVTDLPRRGGRNQELALAAIERCWARGLDGIAILSGGTDGEDGPTDAAGAVADAESLGKARAQERHPAPYLDINDSYTFFDAVGGLLKTGPTHTNVMDLRVALVATSASSRRP